MYATWPVMMLRTLYELQTQLRRTDRRRYHAVYEWAIAKQDAHDTELAIWKPWLQRD